MVRFFLNHSTVFGFVTTPNKVCMFTMTARRYTRNSFGPTESYILSCLQELGRIHKVSVLVLFHALVVREEADYLFNGPQEIRAQNMNAQCW
jgi:hypothetical protein